MKNKKINDKKVYILIIILLLTVGLLFYQSHKPIGKSNNLSIKISETFIKLLNLDMDLNRMNYIVRKSAHFLSYMFIGFILLNIYKPNLKDRKIGYIKVFIISLILASFDEFHQLFVDGRYGSVRDIIIDIFGSIFAMIIYTLIKYFRAKK